ncbi:MAG: ornithine cyclodeaminase family protein [Acidobacteriota bacterium]|jgi:ornithine cyclodeaminase/alanine dehydrogenase-like protein (mu-crystallin family)|nr:ornithine cyclodeaminase family protein [Acidobacteriota bacterium]
MAIFLKESDVTELSCIKMAIDAVEKAFRLQGEGKIHLAPRRRCLTDKSILHVMGASLPTLGYAGVKSYTSVAGGFRFVVLIYKDDGQLAAVIEADKLGQLRTGAASAVATKYMAREDASVLGVFGAGWQARAQIEAIAAVRPIKNVVVHSRTADKLENFCKEVAATTGLEVTAAAKPADAACETDIIVTATTSEVPVLKGEWVGKGTHINAVGSNFLSKQELDVKTVGKCSCVVVDSAEQAILECGDLAKAVEAEAFYWEDARDLGLVVAGEYPGREDASEITLFESQGIALEDVVLAAEIYEKAVKEGRGEKLPF